MLSVQPVYRRPNVELAESAGAQTDVGVLVDRRLATSVPDIFATRDVTQGPVFIADRQEVDVIQSTVADPGRIA
jgi:NADPH-dependent 2,4-dienoyl-CoA reductase/sulfur reductase-like enzyme